MIGGIGMLRIGLLLVLLTISGTVVAQQAIPFQLRDNLISVPATIGGKSISAVLDSGTGTMLVSKSLAAKLGLQMHDSSLQAAGVGSANQSLFPVKLQTIRFGPVDLHKVSGYAINLDSISSSSGFRVDALLGYPVFVDHAIRVNYAKRYVLIYPEGESPTCPNPIPIKIIHNVPVVVAKAKTRPDTEARTVHLVVDLGSRHYNYLGAAFLETKSGKTLYAKGRKQVVGSGTGGHSKGVVAKFAELSIGSQNFHDVTFALTKQVKAFNLKEIHGSLGVPLWKGGVVTFDYTEKRLCIETPHK
jgi:hypothetical protein